MKTRSASPTLLAVAILAATPFQADAVRIDYTAGIGVEYDDNVLMSPTDPEESTALRAGFGFVATEDSSRIRANVGGRLEYWDYLDGPQSDAFEASLAGRLDWLLIPETLSFTVEDSMEMRPIDRFAPDTADNRQRVNVLALGPNLDFGRTRPIRGRLELRWIDTRAEEADDLESQRISAALHAIRDIDPTTRLSLSLRGQDVDFEHDLAARDHRRYDAYLSYDRRQARVGYGLMAGYTWVDYDDGASTSHPLLRANVDWSLSARTTLSLVAAHQLTDSSDSALSGISEVSGIPDRPSATPLSADPSLYEEDRVDLSWAYRDERFALSVGPYYERIDYIDAGSFDETRRGVMARASYRVAPSWGLHAFADIARSEFDNTGLRTDDNRYGAGVEKTWSRHWSTSLDYVHYQRKDDGLIGDSRQNTWYLTVTYRNR